MMLYWPIRIYKSLRFRLLKRLAQMRSRPLFEEGTRRLLERYQAQPVAAAPSGEAAPLAEAALPDEAVPLNERLSVLLSYRITGEERHDILRVVTGRLDAALGGSGLPLLVRDASGKEEAARARALLETIDLPLGYQNRSQKLAPAYSELLAEARTKYFYLQFDDFVTAGLCPAFLHSCCSLLDKYEGLIGCIPIMWPYGVEVDHNARAVVVTDYRRSRKNGRNYYHFGYGRPQTPLFIEKFGGYRFGIFRNFNYGFFFNHLIAPRADYLRRLEWYREHVSQDSVHAIEMAAEHCTVGPFWTHVAICLSNVCLLDLDYSHTPAAVRPQSETNREVCEAVSRGYAVEVRSL